jgi:dimethylargininase
MLHALTNDVSPKLADAYPSVDLALARRQQDQYRDALRRCGATVEELSENSEFPDGCFVEDVALVVDEVAIVTTMGTGRRRGEPEAFVEILGRYRPVERIPVDACIEGGDVLAIGRRIFVGVSGRTDARGVDALTRLLRPRGYTVRAVELHGGLHLKTACTALAADTLIANREWLDVSGFDACEIIDVAPGEPMAANTLRVGDTILMHESCSRTLDRVRRRFDAVEAINISEFVKAEAGLTCLSLVFDVIS